MKNDMLMYLQEVLGEGIKAETYKRIIDLLEQSTLSVQFNEGKCDFESLILSFLERLEIALEQMENLPEHSERGSEREKFLNLITDLLKMGMITPKEYEVSLREPENSSLPCLLNSLRNEARELYFMLIIEHLRVA